MDPTRGDSRYNLNYSMSSIGLSLADQADMYGNPAAVAALGGRPPSGGLIQTMGGSGATGVGLSGRGGGGGGLMPNTAQCQTLGNTNNTTSPQQHQRGIKRTGSDCYEDHHRAGGSNTSLAQSLQVLDSCGTAPVGGGNGQQQQGGNVPDVVDDSYNSLQNKKSPPANGKKTKGRVKIKMEYIDNKLRRYTTFSKRKTGIMKKAYELSTLTGTQVMLLVASETGHVYTFATRKLQPMITSEAGKQLIQTCLNSPDPPSVGGGDQRMSATGFEETELSYNIADEDSKDERSPLTSGNESEDSSDVESNGPVAFSGTLLNALETNTSKKDERSVPQSAQAKKVPSRVVTSTVTAANTSERLPNATQTVATVAAAGSRQNYQNTNGSLVVDSESTIANIPQDMLLKFIQSGHLQLHTEEDGHQYVAIPLTSTAANLIKSGKMTATPAGANTAAVQSTALMKPVEAIKQQSSPNATMAIKQELD